MKILIIRLSAIGDTIHCLPVAAAIKREIPGAQVSWLVEPPSLPLLANNPSIDSVFVLPKKDWLSKLSNPASIKSAATEISAWLSDLRAQNFDVAMDFQGLLKSGVCALASGAKRRIGFARTREGAENLLTDRLDVGDYFFPECHIVELNLKLVDYLTSKLGISSQTDPSKHPIEFPLPPTPRESVERLTKLLGIGRGSDPDKGMVQNAVLIPGTTWTTKIWDKEKWCQLAKLLITQVGMRVCLVGGKSESPTNNFIADKLSRQCSENSVLNLTGQTSLLDLVALYERSQIVIGGDSGPLHLAAATGKPAVVGVHGSTPWQRNGPYGPQCRSVSLKLWCQPCFEKKCPLSTIACLNDLQAEMVFKEVQDHLHNLQTRL